MANVSLVTNILSVLTVIGDIFIVVFLLSLVYQYFSKKKINFNIIKENSLFLSFIVALIATLGSLFYSEIAGYTPCKLCWFQRIFMYPQTILLGIALFRKAKRAHYYLIPLNIIGAFIALNHYLIQRMEYATSCGIEAVSCSVKYTFHFGYITIPMMALTAFCLMIIFLYLGQRE
ncbi:disulfide bond formation protein B [Candidatus Pacearchaeota archaeon]|jgi:disulfide bond formation protein DsbB|nr:disulfide bond formation protein B [Candidatus Pacearchaeota archaeon]|tara:strand:+ start:5438 stop:5962 length:525 start_codon:yes stop_codon:yes gene_type:complete